MCKLVAELAGADKQVVSEMFARLERQSSNPGIDLRITGEIYGRLHMKMRELGLDPNDTTPHELYQALLNLTALHDKFLVNRLGIDNPSSSSEIALAVLRFIEHTSLPKQSWALKHTATKKLLKATPPKTLMKLLNYRSVDSMLKRESPGMLLAIARHLEPQAWQLRMLRSYKELKARDFEVRGIEIKFFDHARWTAVGEHFSATRRSNIVHLPEAGAIAILPMTRKNVRGLTLVSLLLIIHYIHEIRSFGTYFKFQQMQPDFAALLVNHLLENKQTHMTIAGQPVHWRVVHRYYGTTARINHPEIFEPHIQPEDLAYRKAEEVLYRLEPALHFWHDIDFVGLPRVDGPISFNMTDMAMNLVNSLPYERRVSYHMQAAIWNEVYCRYAGEPALERQILSQLEKQSMVGDELVLDMEFA